MEKCQLTFQFLTNEPLLVIIAHTEVTHKTGIEMEALTAVSTASLTVYDMCKALSHELIIEDIRLLEKTGGKSGVKFS